MKLYTLFIALILSLYSFAQISNESMPTQVKTSKEDGTDDNYYAATFDYSFTDQADLDKLKAILIRIRPISAPFTLDGSTTDLFFAADFKTHVSANGFTGTYTTNIKMPKDSALPSTADRQASSNDSKYGYDTRLQYTYNDVSINGDFTPLEVFDSSAILSLSGFNKNKLTAYYSTKLDAVVLDTKMSGDYSIYDLTGKVILAGSVSTEISTASLKSGLYILATDSGVLKFVK